MASGGNDNAANTAVLTERNTLASRVTELEVKVNQLEDQCREVTEEKNSLHRQLGQLREENTELNDKVKVLGTLNRYELFKKFCPSKSNEMDGIVVN